MTEICATCSKEIDPKKNSYTDCAKCNMVFCASLTHTCFLEHSEYCDGRALTILEPTHILDKKMEKE